MCTTSVFVQKPFREQGPSLYLSFTLQVGGEFFEVVLARMNEFGRASICGAISGYNALEPPKGIILLLCHGK